MRRRGYLGCVMAALALFTAGCSAPSVTREDPSGCRGDWEPNPQIEAPTLAPGETGELVVTVDGATGLNVGGPAVFGEDDLTVAHDDATLIPEPDVTWQASPPTWSWQECESITAAVPVRAADDASPERSEFDLRVSGPGETASDSLQVHSYVVTVTGE